MVAAAHQTELNLVLDVFDVKRATARARAHQRADDTLGQFLNRFAHAGRGCALRAVYRKKRLHHGHGNLVGFKRHHGAIAANDLILVKRHRRGLFVGRST